MATSSPSLDQLKRAIQIHEEIQRLEGELQSIFSGRGAGNSVTAPAAMTPKATGGKRVASAEARAKMSVAAKARHAKKGASAGPAKAVALETSKKGKRTISPEGRARIVAALKRRWAAVKKSKK